MLDLTSSDSSRLLFFFFSFTGGSSAIASAAASLSSATSMFDSLERFFFFFLGASSSPVPSASTPFYSSSWSRTKSSLMASADAFLDFFDFLLFFPAPACDPSRLSFSIEKGFCSSPSLLSSASAAGALSFLLRFCVPAPIEPLAPDKAPLFSLTLVRETP